MEKETLYSLLCKQTDIADAKTDSLQTLLEEYPCFQTARLLYAKKLDVDESPAFSEELGKASIFCADRKRLFYYIQGDRYARFFADKTVPAIEEDRTQALLDTFLSTLPDEIYELPETNIVSNDYFVYLESVGAGLKPEEDTDNSLKHQDVIDSFIEKADTNNFSFQFEPAKENTPGNQPHDSDNESEESGFLTETLARIYIKQKKYEQALTIIKRLSLNFPKKSVYFADQIRFLEHLIINEKNKK